MKKPPLTNKIVATPSITVDQRYEFIKEIGVGSFGKALLVKRKTTGEYFVIKRISMKDMSKEERIGALNEVKVLQLLKHCNIIAYHEYFEDPTSHELNIVMDYADQGDLYEKIQQQHGKHFDEDQILDWFAQIALAMKHVHDNNILHRDLKTQNIFLNSNSDSKASTTVKLGDFGIAKILNSQTEMANTVIGTPYYLSPELCEDQPYNQKSDVWALGCVLYEMTTLKHAFNGQNLPALVLKILRGIYPPIPAQYSDNLRDLIASMLQKNPDLRPSMEEILSLPFIQVKITQVILRYQNSLRGNLIKSLPQKVKNAVENYIAKSEVSAPEISAHEPQKMNLRELRMKKARDSSTQGADIWLGKQQDELQNMFEELHPTQRIDLNTVVKSKITEFRQELNDLKQKERKESLLLQLQQQQQQQQHLQHRQKRQFNDENAQPVINRQEAKENIVPYNKPIQVIKQVPPQNPNAVNISVGIDKQQLVAMKEQVMKDQNKKRNAERNKEILRRMEAQKQQEQKKKLDPKEKKAMEELQKRKEILLLQKEKREKEKADKEEMGRKMKEHQMKLRNIKPSMDWNNVKNPIPVTPNPITPRNVGPEVVVLTPENNSKAEEERQKEEEKKKKEQERRNNLKKFLRKQKSNAAKPSDDVLVFVKKNKHAPTLHIAEDDINQEELIPMQDLHKPIQHTNLFHHDDYDDDDNPFVLAPERQRSASSASQECMNEDLIEFDDTLQQKSHKKSTTNHSFSPYTDSPIPISTALDQALEQHLFSSSSDLPGSSNSSFNEQQQRLSIRIEYLRRYCEQKFGDELFIELYRFLRELDLDDDDEGIQKGISSIIQNKGKDVVQLQPFISKLHQLIYCEDFFYG